MRMRASPLSPSSHTATNPSKLTHGRAKALAPLAPEYVPEYHASCGVIYVQACSQVPTGTVQREPPPTCIRASLPAGTCIHVPCHTPPEVNIPSRALNQHCGLMPVPPLLVPRLQPRCRTAAVRQRPRHGHVAARVQVYGNHLVQRQPHGPRVVQRHGRRVAARTAARARVVKEACARRKHPQRNGNVCAPVQTGAGEQHRLAASSPYGRKPLAVCARHV